MKFKHGFIYLCFVLLYSTHAYALEGIYSRSVQAEFQTVYERLYKSLEAERFFVVFEPNIGKNMARFQERWGGDYNRNGLEEIRSMVFCNVWYANQASNLDPLALGLCPLHLNLTRKNGTVTVAFPRISLLVQGSPAYTLIQEVEELIIKVIESALK